MAHCCWSCHRPPRRPQGAQQKTWSPLGWTWGWKGDEIRGGDSKTANIYIYMYFRSTRSLRFKNGDGLRDFPFQALHETASFGRRLQCVLDSADCTARQAFFLLQPFLGVNQARFRRLEILVKKEKHSHYGHMSCHSTNAIDTLTSKRSHALLDLLTNTIHAAL